MSTPQFYITFCFLNQKEAGLNCQNSTISTTFQCILRLVVFDVSDLKAFRDLKVVQGPIWPS